MKPASTGNKALHRILKSFSRNSAFMNEYPHFSASNSSIFSHQSIYVRRQVFPTALASLLQIVVYSALNCATNKGRQLQGFLLQPFPKSLSTEPSMWQNTHLPSFGHVNSKSTLRIRNQAPTIQLHINLRVRYIGNTLLAGNATWISYL